MATLLSALGTRLQNRLGIDTVSTLEQARIYEALNAAIAKVASDGMPGATLTFSALARDTIDLTVDTHSANSASLTVTDTIAGEGIFPGDFFKDSAGTYHFLYSVVEGTKTLGLGSPAETAISGTITVYRRSIELPHDGPVMAVTVGSNGVHLQASSGSVVRYGTERSEPAFFAQGYSEGQELSYLSLAPSPDSAGENYIIEQSRFRSKLASSDNYDLPETVLNAIVAEAHRIHVEWSTPQMAEASVLDRQATDFSDGYQKSSTAGGLKRKV